MAKRSARETELRYRLYFRIVDMIGGAVYNVAPWAALVVIAYLLREAIASLAGRHTMADIGFRFLGDFRITETVAFAFGVGGVAYGLRRAKLHRDNVERTASRIKELEARLDPKRSSSRLTSRGGTRPEDRV